MSGETEANISGWTVDTLREHVLRLLDERDNRYQQRFEAQATSLASALAAADRAVQKAELATEKRFEGVNEFRAQLADQARDLMPRLETETLMRGLNEKAELNAKRLDRIEGARGGKSEIVGYVVGVSGAVVGAVAIVVAVVTR